MSCIRLPHARKAWKSITYKLGKLHKTRRSKAMKRARKHPNTPTIKTTRSPKFLATRRSRHKRLANIRSAIFGFYKKPAPIYIDKLFKEPSYDLVDHLKPQIAHNPRIENTAKLPYQVEEEVGGTTRSKGGGLDDIPCNSSDDTWESLALASPLMHGIDERAEEFIARFRRDLAAQEKLARNL